MRNLVTEVLQDVDKQLAESRDKRRFALKDKRDESVRQRVGSVCSISFRNVTTRQNKAGLRDYRIWLSLEKHMTTKGMRVMGRAEGTINVFAKRFKGGRAWCEQGVMSMMDVFVASLNGWSIQNVVGVVLERLEKSEGILKRTRQVKSIPKQVTELVRQNIPVLGQSVAKPLYAALRD
ncbi:UPF0236 family transposase-like protein [Bacillus fonticola]|uniref:UPF0236 family transposase-like protein n=1 Tax=Bacillus fonticola TaxID=2728853 RepID=UPI001D14AE08|nr:UPF0236 family protein [Bacillus fonticola]